MLLYLASRADRVRLGGRRPDVAARRLATDVGLAIAVAAIDLYAAWDEAHSPVQGQPQLKLPAVPGWAYVFVVVAGLALAWRRRWPLVSFTAVTAATFVYTALGYNDGGPLLALAVSLYSLATIVTTRPALVATAIAIVTCEGALIASGPFGVTQGPNGVLPWMLLAGTGTGFFVASRRAQAAQMRERAEQAARSREEEARRQVEVERLRIARELHDVVAHSMATVNVQAGVALHLLRGPWAPGGDGAPPPAELERAMAAMEAVRVTSKEALRELRGLLNLLRSSSEEPEPTSPVPKLTQIGDLLEVTAKAGLPAELRVLGEPRDLPPATDLAAYRIIQEALTNTLRHAGPAKAIVTLSYAPKRLTIEVADDGKSQAAGPGPEAGAGKGLLGMRERAEALGGELEVGAVAGGGFKVRAELPCPPEGPPAGTRVPGGGVPDGRVPGMQVGAPSGPSGQGVAQVPRPAL